MKDQKYDILIVDDAYENFVVISSFLGDLEELNLHYCSSGEEALTLLQKQTFSTILLDLNMDGISGEETLLAYYQYCRQKNIPPTPMVAVSAFSLGKDVEHCLEIGFANYITKPIKRNALINMMIALLYGENSSRAAQLNEKNKKMINWEDIKSLEDHYKDLDPKLGKYFAQYVLDKVDDLEQMIHSIQQNETVEVRNICHKISGTARCFGLYRMEATIDSVHDFARKDSLADNKEQLVKLLLDTTSYLKSIV